MSGAGGLVAGVNEVTFTNTGTPILFDGTTPTATVTEGDLFPGGIPSFGVSSRPGSVTVDHVNAGALQISTARFGLMAVKVTTTGANVPGVKAGILTIALVALTTVSDCNPAPAFT